jgi:hypothetical protein
MNSKNPKYYKGTLEREGMGEVAYYFKKAGQNIAFATYSLDNAGFQDSSLRVKAIIDKVEEIKRLAGEVVAEIDKASIEICESAEAKEESAKAQEKQDQERRAQILESMQPKRKARR